MSSSSAPATVDHSDADQSLSSCPHHAPRRIPLLSVSIALLVFKERTVKGGAMGKGLLGATFISPGEDGTVVDVIDERGYVDGARQLSTSKLREWKKLFGGEEQDELDDDELVNNNAEDQGSDEVDEVRTMRLQESVSEEGKHPLLLAMETVLQRKRIPKTRRRNNRFSSSSTQLARMSLLLTHQSRGSVGGLGESLFMFRLPTASNMAPSSQPLPAMIVPTQQQPYQNNTSQPQQYLLATSALFSFIYSPLTQSYFQCNHHHHHHQWPGVVRNHPP
ncbi:hypothetical protein M378DRAFT_18397 [Amanita muscaria Koide BX008]|uniref:Uncharacterized protein n=1 Tax=Amanita muscaria (strain Koide BX008) TaxID=946122 RepID=A0A0C2SLZ3_AMAMK|nr:hypothetical protein M378DRAFT_18397 [Amanita muscaria Koide BX008]